MNYERLNQSLIDAETIETILRKMDLLLKENERIQKEWNDPTKWWNR